MQLIRGIHNLRDSHQGCVATIGNFDGVHCGHRAVLKQLQAHAERLKLPVTVITFEPTPQEFFTPDRAPARLCRLREKLAAFKRLNVDQVLCLRFDAKLAEQVPELFIEQILIEGLNIRYLVVGDDFQFGKQRSGDFAMLEAAGRHHGFPVENTLTYLDDGERVSSTRIRDALEKGDLDTAQRLLGRPYSIQGRVARGDQRGRTIGFPTANIRLHRQRTPLSGVFAVTVDGLDKHSLPAVANLGSRPTVGGTELVLEVHIFDFNKDIYDAHVEVNFDTKLREEKKFESFEALKEQIQLDALAARDCFSSQMQSRRV
jgi:riboflavin kinase/FMN adenylyltransferase